MHCEYTLYLTLILLFSCHQKIDEVVEVIPSSGEKLVYEIDKNSGLKHGRFIRFINGDKVEEANYVNDTLHGQRLIFDSLQNTIIEEHYAKGQFHGPYRTYYTNGQLLIEANYRNGNMEGDLKKYYQHGQLMEHVTMVNNQENGPFIEYYANGNLKAKGSYVEGDYEHGELRLFREDDGELERIMICNHGICSTTWHIDSLQNE